MARRRVKGAAAAAPQTGRLIDELDRVAEQRGYPKVLCCDNGPERACTAMADWAQDRVGLAFIPPGQPWRNGYIESFNGRLRDECLNTSCPGSWSTPGSPSTTGIPSTTTTDATQPSATKPQPDTLSTAPTNDRLSLSLDQLLGFPQSGLIAAGPMRVAVRTDHCCGGTKGLEGWPV